jgi:hypothetical protein
LGAKTGNRINTVPGIYIKRGCFWPKKKKTWQWQWQKIALGIIISPQNQLWCGAGTHAFAGNYRYLV